MQVDLITETNSDLTVVNAARCSFDKESRWSDNDYGFKLQDKDIKLIKYLANHNHWTPFAHPQEIFEIHLFKGDALYFFTHANLSGFEWSEGYNLSVDSDNSMAYKVRGSLYAWLSNLHRLPDSIAYNIARILFKKYPVSFKALSDMIVNALIKYEPSQVRHIDDLNELRMYDELQSYTLRLHIPIFVKRQLETHRRNLVMTDIEDFSQNEVSRRYVDKEPEFYYPQWKFQSKSKKQGADDTLLKDIDETANYLTDSNYYHTTYQASLFYQRMNEIGVAHEQSRAILPLSTYTTFWWTGSVKSWRRIVELRTDSHAQGETREVAMMIRELLKI